MGSYPGADYGAEGYDDYSHDGAEDPQALADPQSGAPLDASWRHGEDQHYGGPGATGHGYNGASDGPHGGTDFHDDFAAHGGGMPYLADEGALGAPLDDDLDEPELNAMGRCMYRLSSVSCSGGCMFAVVWTLLQLCLMLPFLVPASVLLVLFGLLQGSPTIIFRSYVAMSISKRVGCNVRVLFFVLAPIALLILLVLGPVTAGLGMLSFLITRTYMINRTDVVQVQRTTTFHTLKLLTSGVTGPCSDFLRQSEVFFLAISHGVYQFLFWLGDQRPNRHRAWPEPFEIRVDWFVVSVVVGVMFAPVQAIVFGVVGVVAYLPSIVTAIRRVYSDPEHFGLGLADIKANPSRCLLAFLALLGLPIVTAFAVAILPILGFVLGFKSAFVAYWTTQTAWRGGFIMWNDFGPDRFRMPPTRRDSFAIWQEQQEAKLANAAVEDARITAAASRRHVLGRGAAAGGDGPAVDEEANLPSAGASGTGQGAAAGAAHDDVDPAAGHDGAPDADGSGDPESHLDAKRAVTPPRAPAASLPGRTVVGRVPNGRSLDQITVIVPIQPGLPRASRSAPRFGESAAPHRSPRRQPPPDGFDFAADPVQTPGGPRHPMPAAGSDLPPHAYGPPVEAPPPPPETPKPQLPRGISAACTDLGDDQRFLTKVLAFTILDIPFWDEALTTTSCCTASACSCDVFTAVVSSLFWGLIGMAFMPVFGALWAVLTCVPVTIRVVVAFVNPVLFPVKPVKPTFLRWTWYVVIAWPLYLLALLFLPVVLVIILVFYLVFCLVEGARVGPVQAFESMGDNPFPRAGRALGRAMRAQDHALFRFIYNRAGTTEVPGTLIGYSLSLMCDELDHPSELEQSYMDELSLKNLHATTKRTRLQGGIATEEGFIRRFDPARAGLTSARHFLTVSFLPPAQPKDDGNDVGANLRAVDSSRRKPRRARYSARQMHEARVAQLAGSGGQGAHGYEHEQGADHEYGAEHEDDEVEAPEHAPAAEGVSVSERPDAYADEQEGQAKAGEAAATGEAEAQPQGRGEPPGKAGSCCPCCDPDSWEESLRVESAPRVLQHHYESTPRRTQLREAREASVGTSSRIGQSSPARTSSRHPTSASQRSASLAPADSDAARAGSGAALTSAAAADADSNADTDAAAQDGMAGEHEAIVAGASAAPSPAGAGQVPAALVGSDGGLTASSPATGEQAVPATAASGETGPGTGEGLEQARVRDAELAAAAQLLAARRMGGDDADSASVDSASDDDQQDDDGVEVEADDVIVDPDEVGDDDSSLPAVAAPPAGVAAPAPSAAGQAKPGVARFTAPPNVSVPASPMIEEDEIIIEEEDEEDEEEEEEDGGRTTSSRATSLGGHGFQPASSVLPAQADSAAAASSQAPTASPAAHGMPSDAAAADGGEDDDDDDDDILVGSESDEETAQDQSASTALPPAGLSSSGAQSGAPAAPSAAPAAPDAVARATALLGRLREKRATAAAGQQS